MRNLFRPRLLSAFGAGCLLLSACGGSGTADPASASGDTDAEPATASDADAGGGAADAEVTVTHAQGETPIPVDPQTVVTFDLGALDSLDAMGVEVAGIPEVAVLPDRLAGYTDDEYVEVGTLFEPDYEQVNALDPDLIIVGGRSSAVYPELAEIAPTIDLTVDNGDFVASFRQHLTTLGAIFERSDWVEERLQQLDGRIAEVRELAQDGGDALIVMTSGGEVSAYGPGSRFGIIHDVFGVGPSVEDVEAATHGDAISFEFILEADPDHLFVLDRDAAIGESGEAAEVVLDNELVAETTAWQQDEVHYLDGVNWYLLPSGLRSLEAMVDEVGDALT